MGVELSRPRGLGRCRWPRPRATPPKTSRSTRWAARRSWPIPTGRAAPITPWTPVPPRDSPWPAWPRTSPIFRKRHCSGNSAAALQNRDAISFGFGARLPDRELSASPGHDLRRPLRRQFLSLHHPRDGLFRSRGRPWRRARRKPSAARARASASSRSPATGCFRPAENKRIAHALNAVGRQCQLRRDRDRQGP